MKKTFFPLFLFAVLVSVSGCGASSPLTGIAPQPVPKEERLTKWTEITPGVEHIRLYNASGTELGELIAMDPEVYEFSFKNSAQNPKTVSEWLTATPEATLVMNGVYFHEDFWPSGKLVTNGKNVGEREFDVSKSSVFVLKPNLMITDDHEIARADHSEEAAQSYPMLEFLGQNLVEKDSGNNGRRSFFGIRDDHFAVFGTVNTSEISLYELGNLLSQKELRLTQAINLDGGSSTGLMTRYEKAIKANSIVPVPNVIIATKK